MRSGVTRAAVEPHPIRRLGPGSSVRLDFPSKSFPFSFLLLSEVFFPKDLKVRVADRCRRFLLCFGSVATHQLLSGQLRSNPTPTVSYLCDCGDRGIRPI